MLERIGDDSDRGSAPDSRSTVTPSVRRTPTRNQSDSSKALELPLTLDFSVDDVNLYSTFADVKVEQSGDAVHLRTSAPKNSIHYFDWNILIPANQGYLVSVDIESTAGMGEILVVVDIVGGTAVCLYADPVKLRWCVTRETTTSQPIKTLQDWTSMPRFVTRLGNVRVRVMNGSLAASFNGSTFGTLNPVKTDTRRVGSAGVGFGVANASLSGSPSFRASIKKFRVDAID
jgi:hypothetical protein